MRKILLVMLAFVLLGHAAAEASSVADAPGMVTFSVNYTVYFDSEANAVRWLESQQDFVSRRESTEGERRVMANVMEGMFPNWSDMVRMHSDFLVMVVRSSTPGESSLSLYVRGVLTRFWNY